MKRSRGTEYFTSKDILSTVQDIRTAVEKGDRRDVIEKRFPDFAARHTHLFNMACEDEFNMDRLKFMLDLRDDVEKKKVTFEDASKVVGQKMFDVYVKDKISAPPTQ